MTSFDISLYGDGLRFLADWDDDGAFANPHADVTENWLKSNYEYGTARRSNPQRPTILAGRGALVLIRRRVRAGALAGVLPGAAPGAAPAARHARIEPAV